MMTRTRLYRSSTDKMVFGVCGGLADYFNVDSVLVRIAFVVLTLAWGAGLLFYLLLAILVPKQESTVAEPGDVMRENLQTIATEATEAGRRGVDTVSSAFRRESSDQSEPSDSPDQRRNTLAIILIAIGVLILLANLGLFRWFDWDTFWPILLILLGFAIIIGRFRTS
jgi:phage shock protein PspC (stress-responsive transcriptional regulator)